MHALKAGQVECPAVERGLRIDADALLIHGLGVVILQHGGIDAHDLAQKRLIAHAREALLFLVGRKSGQVIDRARLQLDDLIARLGGEGRAHEGLRETRLVGADDELVGAERLAIEEYARLEPKVIVVLQVLGLFHEARDIQP